MAGGDNLDKILKNPQVAKELRDQSKSWPAVKQDQDPATGILGPKIAAGSTPPGLTRRYFNRTFGLGIAFAKWLKPKDAGILIDTSALIISIVALNKSYSDDDKKDWGLDHGLAARISAMPYNDPRIPSLKFEAGTNRGGQAFIDSVIFNKTGGMIDIEENTLNLVKTLDCSDGDFVRNIVLSRLMANEYFRSNGIEANEYMRKINLKGLGDHYVQAKILDYSASIIFNGASSIGFARFSGLDLNQLINGWSDIGIDINNRDEDKYLVKNFGLHIFTVQQLRCFFACQSLNGSGNLFMNLRHLRQQMIEEFFRALSLAKNTPHLKSLSADFLGSLQRPAFHAFYTGDYEHTKHILDIYFGRNASKRSVRLDQARKYVLETGGLNRQWMLLLDIILKARTDKSGAQRNFDNFVRDLRVKANKSDIKSQAVLRSLPYVSDKVELDTQRLFAESPSIRSSIFHEITLHKAYMDAMAIGVRA